MNKRISYYILPLCLFWSSCGDFLEYKDKDKIIPRELAHYNELVYGELMKKTSGDEMMYLQFMTDEVESIVLPLSSSSRTDSRREDYGNFTWATDHQLDQDEREHNDKAWAHFYHKILMCNVIEHDLGDFENDTKGVKKRLLGEVIFLRAISYYYLVNLYGEPYKNKEQAKTALGVPINTTISLENKVYTRAKLQETYELIENELLRSIDFLTEGEQSNTIFRPNVDGAKLFLSRIYLYQKEWKKALDISNDLISMSNSSIETLTNMSNYIKSRRYLYNDQNAGILFSWGKRFGSPFTSKSDAGHWEVSSELKKMYINTDTIKDVRGQAFFSQYSPYYPNKYEANGGSCYHWSYRIEEAYLNRAEACIELGGETNLVQAMSDINSIRRNRITGGGYERKATDTQEAKKILQDEKRMEFCFEDTRWFDIRRWEIEITHKLHNINSPTVYDTYVLKAGSPNYIINIPLEVQKINFKIEQFERENTLVGK